MSTSLTQFARIADRYPGEVAALGRLSELIADESRRDLTFDRLVELLDPASTETLARILADLIQAQLVKRVVRVESPSSGGGVEEYSSLVAVPTQIYDWRTDQIIDVRPEYITQLFTFPGR